MLNTGIFFLRRSMWSWRFLQKVRRMTFGASYFFVGNQTDLFSSNFSAFRVHTYLLLPPFSRGVLNIFVLKIKDVLRA